MNTFLRLHATTLFAVAMLFGLSIRTAHAADASAGGDVYDEECSDCHSVKPAKNKKGPTLFAVVGRHAGTVPGYVYSAPMRASGIVWTPDKLQAYIRAPKTAVPGGKMKYDGSKLSAGDIADLIAFLSTNR